MGGVWMGGACLVPSWEGCPKGGVGFGVWADSPLPLLGGDLDAYVHWVMVSARRDRSVSTSILSKISMAKP